MVTVGLYIYINDVARRIELFEDEKISINSSVQNASDISKVYTDFSQSFTIPANDHNNAIFSHWYENSIDNGYDARKRKRAYIELDTILFKNGNIQLETATIKNGVPENYTITFFGSLVSLKDTFADKKLSELDYSSYTIEYNDNKVIDVVKGQVNNDVKFPLITSNRVWNDENTATTVDITQSATGIEYSELFPALRVSKIFECIADYYNITFNGSFLTNPKFTRAFLWLKNADVFNSNGQISKINYQTQTGSSDRTGFSWNLTTDEIKINPIPLALGWTDTVRRVTLDFNFTTAGINYYVYVYKNGEVLSTITNVTTVTTQSYIVLEQYGNDGSNTDVYTFNISSAAPVTFTSEAILYTNYRNNLGVLQFVTTTLNQTTPITTSSLLSLNKYFPDMKVEDFFSGILKMFNLTCLGYEEGVYSIEQLEDWYDSGDIIDITKHALSDDLQIGKLETFKSINFNYTKSESFMNVNYLGNIGFEYGNLRANLDAEGSEYTVQLPFENLLFNKFNGQNLQVGYSLKTDFKQYIPKPVILYDYGTLQSCDFYLKGIGTSTNILEYNCFGQDTLISSVNQSINFGIEISSLLLIPINNTLYSNYYEEYLQNIYNIKSRKYNVKALLPISLLTSIKLNNRLVIRDKRYIINNMKIDLTSGEVDFELINDFRTL